MLPTMEQDYLTAAQQAYLSFMQKQRSMPQAYATKGLTGGVVERGSNTLKSGYGDTANLLKQNLKTAKSELDSDISNMRRTQNLSATGSAQSYRQKLSQLLNKQQQEWNNLLESL